jgi:DNA topoisomerase-3
LLEKGTTGELDSFRDMRGRTYKAILSLEGKDLVLKPIAGSTEEGGDAVTQIEFEVNPEPLGPCPIHKDEECLVVESPTHFICQSRQKQIEAGERKPTGILLPRLVCKREMSRAEALQFIQTGETPLIEDFISRFGRPFKAKLALDPKTGRHKFEFPPREGGGRRGGFKKKKADEGADGETKQAASKKKAAVKKKTAKKKTTTKKKSSKKTSETV